MLRPLRPNQVVDAHGARHVGVRLGVEVGFEHAATARHARHAKLLAMTPAGDGHTQRVVARGVVDDIAVQLDTLAEARVERHAQHQHLLVCWDRFKDDDAAAQRERVERVPAKIAADVDHDAVGTANAALWGAALPGRLVPRMSQRWLEDQLLPHPGHVVVVRLERKGERWMRSCRDGLQILPGRRGPAVDQLGAN